MELTEGRWPGERFTRFDRRVLDQSLARGGGPAGVFHLWLALLRPPRPTIAAEVITALGLSAAAIEARLPPPADPLPERREAGNTADVYAIQCLASGIAIARSATKVTDELMLLAIFYARSDEYARAGLDADAVYDALAARGVEVPPLRPPLAVAAM